MPNFDLKKRVESRWRIFAAAICFSLVLTLPIVGATPSYASQNHSNPDRANNKRAVSVTASRLSDRTSFIWAATSAQGNGGSLDRRVTASADDAEEESNGNGNLTSSDIDLGEIPIGIRFRNITTPQGAIINDAWIQFTAEGNDSESTNLVIRGHDTDDAPTFNTSSGAITGRPTTSASVNWSVPAWTNVGAASSAQRTPSLASIVQEIVNRAGWQSGNDLALIITGSGQRDAESYDGSSSQAPLLHIDYTIPSVNQPPVITNPGNQTNVEGDSVNLSISATDPDGDSLSYGASGLPNGLSINSATGVIVGTVNTVGPFNVTVTADDGNGGTDSASFTWAVNAGSTTVLIDANFDTNSNGFSYLDDAFRNTNQPSYASGSHLTSGGFSGGALRVLVGGINGNDIVNMSGGWQSTFSLSQPSAVSISFRYNLSMHDNYENDEYAQMLVSVDGILHGQSPNDYIVQLNGGGGTGWQIFSIDLGQLAAGSSTYP